MVKFFWQFLLGAKRSYMYWDVSMAGNNYTKPVQKDWTISWICRMGALYSRIMGSNYDGNWEPCSGTPSTPKKLVNFCPEKSEQLKLHTCQLSFSFQFHTFEHSNNMPVISPVYRAPPTELCDKRPLLHSTLSAEMPLHSYMTDGSLFGHLFAGQSLLALKGKFLGDKTDMHGHVSIRTHILYQAALTYSTCLVAYSN